LPKEIMELQGFPHKGPEDKSYVAANEMLKYLEDYADHFNLRKHIKVITNNILILIDRYITNYYLYTNYIIVPSPRKRN